MNIVERAVEKIKHSYPATEDDLRRREKIDVGLCFGLLTIGLAIGIHTTGNEAVAAICLISINFVGFDAYLADMRHLALQTLRKKTQRNVERLLLPDGQLTQEAIQALRDDGELPGGGEQSNSAD